MSKKKNTLKDLDEFLKQQAATLVNPQKLGEAESETGKPDAKDESASSIADNSSLDSIVAGLKQLSKNDPNFRNHLYNLIIETLEAQHPSTAEDKILINTALYLKHGKNWKQAIREYWRNAG